MAKIVFTEKEPDWIIFAGAGHLRQLYPGTPIEMIATCKLDDLPATEELFLEGHGSSFNCGDFYDARELAQTLEKRGLKKDHRSLTLMSCDASVLPKIAMLTLTFAEHVIDQLKDLGYDKLTVKGGRGAVVIYPKGRLGVVKPKQRDLSDKLESELKKKFSNEIEHCSLRVKRALVSPTPKELENAADEIATASLLFYEQLSIAFGPLQRKEAKGFQQYF